MGGTVDKTVLKERSGRARSIAAELGYNYKNEFTGRVLPVLVMEHNRGLSHNYIEVHLSHTDRCTGMIVPVEITAVDEKKCRGTIKILDNEVIL